MTSNFPNSFIEKLQKRKVIPFVGAGVCMTITDQLGNTLFPSWSEMLYSAETFLISEGKSKIASNVNALLNLPQPDYYQAAQIAQNALGPQWYDYLKSQINYRIDQIDKNSLALVRAIWKIGSPFIITSNYDKSLFWSCPDQGNFSRWDIENVVQQGQFLSNGLPENPTVWHLHGHIDNPAKIILTMEGYLKLYSGNQGEIEYKAAQDTFRSIIKSYSLLFIGCSLNDKFVTDQLIYVNDLYEASIGPHYILTVENELVKIETKNLPVTPITYSEYGLPLIDKINEIADIAVGQLPLTTHVKTGADIPSEETSQNSTNLRSTRALIMKGGGIKGLAYVGAIDILKEKYDFNWFVGTSAGAIIAILLGAGYSTDELKVILQNKNFKDFFDAKWYKKPTNLLFYHGVHPADSFTFWLDDLLAKKLNSPSRVKLSDLPNRVTVYASRRGMSALKFDSKDSNVDAAYAARCSMSIPWVFIPQSDQGFRAYDGGIQHNYPVEELLREYPNTSFISLFLGSETYEPVKEKWVIFDLLSIATEPSDSETVKKYRDKTVIIDPRPIETLDFSLTEDEKEFLLLVGKTAALAHLENGSADHLTARKSRDSIKGPVEDAHKSRKRRRCWTRIIILVLCIIIFGLGIWRLI